MGAMAPVILRKRLIAPAVSTRNGKILVTLSTINIKILKTPLQFLLFWDDIHKDLGGNIWKLLIVLVFNISYFFFMFPFQVVLKWSLGGTIPILVLAAGSQEWI